MSVTSTIRAAVPATSGQEVVACWEAFTFFREKAVEVVVVYKPNFNFASRNIEDEDYDTVALSIGALF